MLCFQKCTVAVVNGSSAFTFCCMMCTYGLLVLRMRGRYSRLTKKDLDAGIDCLGLGCCMSVLLQSYPNIEI